MPTLRDYEIRVAPELRQIVSLGVLAVAGAVVGETSGEVLAAIEETERRMRATPAPANLQATRTLYRQTGLDPTRRRPSSEALLRRVVRGESLPRINSAVDACNWCSLELQLPYGLYDLDRVRPPVELRLGAPGEEYAGIRKEVVHVEGRMTLADACGPFGNPSADSARTMVTPGATRLLAVIFAPRHIGPAVLDRALDLTSARLEQATGATTIGRYVV